MTDTENQPPIIAHVDDIDREFAERAFHGTSHSPEKRGQSRREWYAEAVNGLYAEMWKLAKTEEQKALLAEEMERYKQGYIQRLNAYLQSHSSVFSTTIAGPANFPVARMQKRSQWADNKANELLTWDKKASASIKQKMLDARPQEEKDAAEWNAVRRDIAGSLASIKDIDENGGPYSRPLFVSNLAGRLERLAQNGEIELVSKSLELLREYDASHKKPAFTPRHKVWTYDKLAEEARARDEARAGKPQALLAEENGVELWVNYQLDRVQLVFPDKPDHAMREKLKRSGWKWAPSQEAWQRQLTNAGIESGKAILAGLKPERDDSQREVG